MQYTHDLGAGRLGVSLNVYRRDDEGAILHTYTCMVSNRGFEVQRHRDNLPSTRVEVCTFESFLYPDRPEEGEYLMLEMLIEGNIDSDRKVMELCSMLCALWAGGHEEAMLDQTVHKTIGKW